MGTIFIGLPEIQTCLHSGEPVKIKPCASGLWSATTPFIPTHPGITRMHCYKTNTTLRPIGQAVISEN